MHGHLIWFNSEKRHGFIRTADGERLLVEASGFVPGHVPVGRCGGTPLTFEREAAAVEGGARAVSVAVHIDPTPRRARRRRL
jgi:cold shock CspA family protein